jgi:hypothetical protein
VRSFFPEGQGVIEAHRFGPAFSFPETDGVRGLNDITPRMGGSYDLFGNGKTARATGWRRSRRASPRSSRRARRLEAETAAV